MYYGIQRERKERIGHRVQMERRGNQNGERSKIPWIHPL